jgi:hypothetical protein
MRYLSRARLLAAVSLIASMAVWHAPANAQDMAQDKTQDESGAWVEKAAALVPAGFVAGRAYRVDRETMTGFPHRFGRCGDAGKRFRSRIYGGGEARSRRRQTDFRVRHVHPPHLGGHHGFGE